MKLVTFDDIIKLEIAPHICYEWVVEMIKQKEKALLPEKISMKLSKKVYCNVMPCILQYGSEHMQTDIGYGGVKVVTRYPDRVPGLDSKLLLFDAASGKFLALMDANWITAMRTGAVAAHSISLFAKKDFSILGLMGLGNTTRATLLTLLNVFPEKRFQVKLLKYKEQEISFMERFSEFDNVCFQCVGTTSDLVKGSDVVISAVTYLSDDICKRDCFDEGVLVVPIHTRGFTNCDLFFDKVYADDRAHVQHFSNFNKFRYFAEVSDVVNGNAMGRENDKERILAYNIGVAMHDINFATHIYQLLTDNEEITDINLKTPVDKFWI